MRAFLATAEAGSLSGAAKALGLTQPTLSRQVSALEDQLSLLLFERVGRGLALTDAGRELLAHVRDMGAAADRLTVSAVGQQSGISGRVSISASDILSHILLPGVVADLRRRAPQLAIEVVATNQLSDLLRREADIAIRHVRPRSRTWSRGGCATGTACSMAPQTTSIAAAARPRPRPWPSWTGSPSARRN